MIDITKPSKDYELLDSGEGYKLERFGGIVLARPDPQALWRKRLGEDMWNNADGTFMKGDGKTGSWKFKGEKKERWNIEFGTLKFVIKPSPFKHVGLFPEQSVNWAWTQEKIAGRLAAKRPVSVLNLFGYTGGATLACAQAGAQVTHVDASKAALTWANENAEVSGLKDTPIRWILDDALEFVKKELKRGKRYEGIIMDPPAFGRGVNNEVWKIEDDFLKLFDAVTELLSKDPLFLMVNGYASGYSALAYENNLKSLMEKLGGTVESGELAIEETGSGRLLPCGIFSRWFLDK
jgi:23S rRNA (cytosine1962-C5)-methyltransferase